MSDETVSDGLSGSGIAARARHAPASPAAQRKASSTVIVTLFLLSTVVPFILTVGPLRLSANRLVLILVIAPLVLQWLIGRAGRVRITDALVLFLCFWTTISFFVVHGPSLGVESSGIFVIETFGAFLVGRCCIRDERTFHAMVSVFFKIILFMLPFALIETLTGRNVLLEVADKIWITEDDVPKEPRWGLDRVQGVFQHPILYGVFCGMGLALVYYVLGYRRAFIRRIFSTGLVWTAAMVSFSSGPLISLLVQAFLIGWDQTLRFLKARWLILAGGVGSMLALVEVVANRTTPEIIISYLAFNTRTAINRLWIWDFGTQSVAKHPWFGIGHNEWERAPWMSTSIDMFWLAPAVRHGLPAGITIQLIFLSVFFAVAFSKIVDKQINSYRTGYLICLSGLYIAGWTVNYWKVNYTMFMFILGAGIWMISRGENVRR